MRDYEVGAILRPDIPEDQLEAAIGRISQLITSRGGEIEKTDVWGRRRMAYPINRFFEGIYCFWRAKMDPAQVQELENQFRISEEILRNLITMK